MYQHLIDTEVSVEDPTLTCDRVCCQRMAVSRLSPDDRKPVVLCAMHRHQLVNAAQFGNGQAWLSNYVPARVYMGVWV